MIYLWDYHLKPEDVFFGRRGMTNQGPISLAGRTQVWQSDAGYWVADLNRIAVKRQSLKRYRRFTALLEGGAHQALVPVYDKYQSPWPVPGQYGSPSLGYTDGNRFTDGTGFLSHSIRISLLSAAAYRATVINITVESAGAIEGGEYFSIGLGNLYLISEVLATVGTDMTIRIWPPLRAALAAGELLQFDRPVCRMRLSSEGVDDVVVEKLRYGFPSLSFIEVFDVPTINDQETDMSCVRTQRKITGAGNYVLSGDSEDIIVIAKSTPQVTAITLPLASSRIGRKPIRIVDGGYNAAAFNITIGITGANLLMGGSSYIIDSNGASIEFTPLADGSGWV